jgi:hypothetical protein
MPSAHPRAHLRRFLWKGWFLLTLLVVTMLAGSFATSKAPSLSLKDIGLDFVAFYRAGVLVSTGHSDQLYDLQATQDFDRDLVWREKIPLGNTVGLFYNPPYFAWLFAPLAALGYSTALSLWLAFQIACFIPAAFLVARIIPSRVMPGTLDERCSVRQWRDWALVPALMVISLPFIQTILHGQNTFLSLLLAAVVVTAWRAGRGFTAGAVAGMLLYKPQLAAVIIAAVIISLGWRAFMGAVLSSVAFLLVNIVTLPGTLEDYLTRLTGNFQWMLANHPYLWQRHVTFRGFWQLILEHINPAMASLIAGKLAIICAVPLGSWLLICIWRNRKSANHDRIIAAVIATMPLIMPYYVDYDLLLLSLPAVLLASEIIRRDDMIPLPKRDAWLIRLWIGLYLLMLINPGLTGTLHVNLCVPLLGSIAIMMIARAAKPAVAQRSAAAHVALSPEKLPLIAAA